MRIGTLHPKARVTNSGGLTGQRKGAKEDNGGREAENRRKPPEGSNKERPAKGGTRKVVAGKDKLRRMSETEIEQLKVEIWQQKEQEDRAQYQINRLLKQKIEEFKNLHMDHKQLEADY